MAKKPTPPKIPRCLCSNWLHWVLQIASPSRFLKAQYSPTVESEMYFQARREYERNLIMWKIKTEPAPGKSGTKSAGGGITAGGTGND